MNNLTPPTLQHDFLDGLPELSVAAQAQPCPNPQLVVCNDELAEEIGIDSSWLRTREGIDFLCGANLAEGTQPISQGYAGHQFGSLSPRLGDGRAMLLGEIADATGRLRDIHLKGSGRTVWARGGDGLCPLEPALKEYAFSEAMHALGVPSNRALAVIDTGATVYRTTAERAAILVRVADSHLRIGTFQYAALLDINRFQNSSMGLTRRVADYAIARHYPELAAGPDRYVQLFRAVMNRQADLVAKWMRFGFIHGVMNTDNITISGETIDFGPCAFMDYFAPSTVYSSIDTAGRYAYDQQPTVMGWDLARLAETLVPLVDAPSGLPAGDSGKAAGGGVEQLTAVMNEYPEAYQQAWTREMAEALGIEHASDADKDSLISAFLTLAAHQQPDYTATLRALAETTAVETSPVRAHLSGDTADQWLRTWWALHPTTETMLQRNPAVIPRNHALKAAMQRINDEGLDAADDYLRIVDAVRHPFTVTGDLPAVATSAGMKNPILSAVPKDRADFTTYCGT
ncbi:YdiU family protein [Corynebacterium falsenii]|uniref:Protein nucleotidyltransferase YdiU n=1 Tax=Corynebacterium falsenii TaxID=108486 RepID=A0A418Q776_9CORY|nr:YdiU family protein [Corynebacterium falsenii]RIX34962.1 YdiU family protein [Corynebacterium falsenii]